MKLIINRIALILFLFAFTASAFADIPSPNKNSKNKPPKSKDVKIAMNITPDRNVTEATLIIPRSMLKQLVAQADGDDSLNAATTNRFNLTPMQTIMFGMFLSLSVVFGGVWFVRTRSQNRNASRIAIAIAMIALCGAAATAAYANAGPPPVARSITSKILIQDAQYYGVWGEVKVQVSDDARGIQLRVPVPKEDKPQ